MKQRAIIAGCVLGSSAGLLGQGALAQPLPSAEPAPPAEAAAPAAGNTQSNATAGEGTAPATPATAEPEPGAPADPPLLDLTGGAIVDAPPAAAVAPPPPPAGPLPPTPGAEEEEEPSYRHGGQRHVGFGPRVGLYSGFGAGARSGSAYVGADISGGWRPVGGTFVFSDDLQEVENWHAWQLNGQVYVSFNPYSRFASGLMAGYAYNSMLRHGFSLGYDAVLNLNAHLGLQLTVGFLAFPDSEQQLRERADVSSDVEVTGTWLDLIGGLQLGMMIFP